MTPVTKFALIGVAVHAGILKAFVIHLPGAALVKPFGFSDNLISPLIKHFHMLGRHKGLRFYALPHLFCLGGELPLRRFCRLTCIIK